MFLRSWLFKFKIDRWNIHVQLRGIYSETVSIGSRSGWRWTSSASTFSWITSFIVYGTDPFCDLFVTYFWTLHMHFHNLRVKGLNSFFFDQIHTRNSTFNYFLWIWTLCWGMECKLQDEERINLWSLAVLVINDHVKWLFNLSCRRLEALILQMIIGVRHFDNLMHA